MITEWIIENPILQTLWGWKWMILSCWFISLYIVLCFIQHATDWDDD